MSHVQQIIAKVDQFATVGKELSILLKSYDPAHADLITGVLGVVKKMAKSYESSAPAVLGSPDTGSSSGFD